MLPVSVPLNVPAPVALLKVIVVAPARFDGLPLASCDCTVTLKAEPAVPVPGTVVYASFVAVPGCNVITHEDAPTAVPTLVPPKVAVTVADPEPTATGEVQVAV